MGMAASSATKPFCKLPFASIHRRPESILKVKVCINVGSVGTSMETSLTFIVGGKGGHISRVTDINHDVRLEVNDEICKEVCSFVVVVWMCVLVRNYKMCCQLMGPRLISWSL